MRIITCAGYFGTGSSAVTDLFSEFSNCTSMGEHEFRFIQDPDGIRDLAYNLVENNHRHNTSNAVKRYIRLANQLNGGLIRKGYKRYMGNSFLKYTDEYISSITELKCKSFWHYDRIERGKIFYFVDNFLGRFFAKVFHKHNVSLLNLMNEQSYYSAIDRKTFYSITRDYLDKVFCSMNQSDTEFIMIDQLVPPSNIDSYLPFFNDIKVIVAERDPRDIYLLCKGVLNHGTVPSQTPMKFCKWYEITRRHRKTEIYDRDKVYFLQFEDLIYDYDRTVEKLINFVGIDKKNHTMPMSHLNPAVSIKNTNLKHQYPQFADDIVYIEKKLPDYLYDFPKACEKNGEELRL